MSARKALAVHEGGHAALAALYGLTVSLVTIAHTTIASAVTGAALDTAGHASCGGELADITAEAEAEKHI